MPSHDPTSPEAVDVFASAVMQAARDLGHAPTTRAVEIHGKTRPWLSWSVRHWGSLRPSTRPAVADCLGLDEQTVDRMWVQYAQV